MEGIIIKPSIVANIKGIKIKPKKNPRVIDWYECRGCLYAPGDGRKNGCKSCGNFKTT